MKPWPFERLKDFTTPLTIGFSKARAEVEAVLVRLVIIGLGNCSVVFGLEQPLCCPYMGGLAVASFSSFSGALDTDMTEIKILTSLQLKRNLFFIWRFCK